MSYTLYLCSGYGPFCLDLLSHGGLLQAPSDESAAAAGAAAAAVVGGGTLAASFRCGATLLAFYFSSSRLTAWMEDRKATDDAFKAGGQRDWVQVPRLRGTCKPPKAFLHALGHSTQPRDRLSLFLRLGLRRPLSETWPRSCPWLAGERHQACSAANQLRSLAARLAADRPDDRTVPGAGQRADPAAGGAGAGAGDRRRGRPHDGCKLPQSRPPARCLPG